MKENSKDLKKVAQQFFSAYDAHDVDGMTALFTADARGWYVPYGKQSVAPVLGGIDAIWRAFPQAVKGFRVEVVDMLLAEGNTIVAEALVGGPLPRPDPLGISKDGQPVMIPHVFILRFATDGKISRVDAYWDNAVLQGIKASAL
jgi:ketosteroid isomerase-like protein